MDINQLRNLWQKVRAEEQLLANQRISHADILSASGPVVELDTDNTNALTFQSGQANRVMKWIWGISRWGGSDIFIGGYLGIGSTIRCSSYSASYYPEKIGDGDTNNFWLAQGLYEEWVEIKLPYKMTPTQIKTKFSSETVSYYIIGSNKERPSDTIWSNYTLDTFSDYYSITNITVSGSTFQLSEGATSGELITKAIALSPAEFNKIYTVFSSFPETGKCIVQTRSSKDIYNWSGWSPIQAALAANITITEHNELSNSLASYIHITKDTATITTENDYIKGTVTLYGTASDDNFTQYKLQWGYGYDAIQFTDIGTYTTPVINGTLGTFNTTNLSDGYYSIRVLVYDEAYNINSDTIKVVVDNTNPTMNITQPVAGEKLTGKVEIRGTANDFNFHSCLIEYGEGSNPTSWTTIELLTEPVLNDILCSWDTSGLTQTTYTIKGTAYDKAGNSSISTVTVTVDNETPHINNVYWSPQQLRLGSTSDLIYTLSENVVSMTIGIYNSNDTLVKTLVNGEARSGGQNTETWDGKDNSGNYVAEGVYTAKLDAIDEQSKEATQKTASITVKDTLPQANITEPVSGSTVGHYISIIGTATDADDFSYYILEYGYGSNPSSWWTLLKSEIPIAASYLGGWNTSGITEGTYTIRLRTYDTAGNYAQDTITVTVDQTLPTAHIEITPETYTTLDSSITITQDTNASLSSSITIEEIHETLDCGFTVNTTIQEDNIDSDEKYYIQVRYRLETTGATGPVVDKMIIRYSSDWFTVVPEKTGSGTVTDKPLNNKICNFLRIIFPRQTYTATPQIYEMAVDHII